MSADKPQPVTVLLHQWKAGDAAALAALVPLVYDELHRLAAHYLRAERAGHTLQSTALVNEAYLRLVNQEPGDIGDRAHFIGVAAHVMRQVLVDYARGSSCSQAGRRAPAWSCAREDHPLQVTNVDVIALDEALTGLADFDPGYCALSSRAEERRFFNGGLWLGKRQANRGLRRCAGSIDGDDQARMGCRESVVEPRARGARLSRRCEINRPAPPAALES